jgi:two-component system CheB/CheR fusion protein
LFLTTLPGICTIRSGVQTVKKISPKAKANKAPVKKVLARKAAEKDLLIKPFPIVGFGASAGGLEAFIKLLKHLDPTLGMAYVLIMHLSPHHKSALTEILKAKTKMPVHTVKDGMEVKANNIFVIPPNTFMSVVDGHLKLAPRAVTSIGNYAVDYFFTGLASLYKNNAIGVILSGTATDGTLGLKAIKAEGGITFAQDGTAEFSGMPHHAFDSGYVDFMLPPEGIAKEFARLGKMPYTVLPSDKIEAVHVKELTDHTEELKKILSIVKSKTGIDFFLHYKLGSIYRRVVRRMVLNKFEKLQEYGTMLKANPKEVEALYDDFLINVTSFFRDPDFYKIITKEIFPAFLKRATPADPIRIWVAGCATGEEAYSIAIALIEFLEKEEQTIPIQIFASDLDANAIEKARAGLYPVGALQGVSTHYLKRYFNKVDGHYQIVKSVRELCVFSHHNLLRDPPFSRIDLISCQNVLIYLETAPQKKILQTFHYSLKPSGHLFLGKSETIGTCHDMFEMLDKKVRLYSRKPAKSPLLAFATPAPSDVLLKESHPAGQHAEIDVEKDMGKLMLSRFVHPGVVVNKNLMIVQFFGITTPYLAPVTGKASFNILKMIREDLVIDLRSLLQRALKTEDVVIKEGIRIYNKKIPVDITIEVVPKKASGATFFLVVFKENAVIQPGKAAGTPLKAGVVQKQQRIEKLEKDLLQAIEVIRTTSEEYETTYEEFQANNEEILSSNEELQSVNEELEASKEELQSANEELTTINEELFKTNTELKDSQSYSEAIVETVHNPFLVLTDDLKVRMANKAFYQTFKLAKEQTEGNSILTIGNNAWNIPVLREHLRSILVENPSFKEFELKYTSPELGELELIVNAYRLKNDTSKESLILLAFNDVTRQTNAEASLLKSQEQLKLSLIGDSIGTWWWDIPTGEMKWSRENELLHGMLEGTFEGLYNHWEALIHPEDILFVKTALKKSIDDRHSLEIEYRVTKPDNSIQWILSKGHAYYDPHGKPERMAGISMDSTERKTQAEKMEAHVHLRTTQLRKAIEELKAVNEQLEQFVFISSHDLQEPLRKIVTFSNFLSNPDANSNDYTKNYSDKISASATRMSNLLRDLISFSILIKRDEKKMVKVNLNHTLKNAIRSFEKVIEEKKAVVNLSPLPTILAEPVQMSQLFHHLISNALKFDREDPVIDITAKEVTAADFSLHQELKRDTAYVSISVRDNGIGFEQKYVPIMFTIFQRLNTKKNTEGTGIGLPICKKVAENHNGFIYAKGEDNKGATFTVFLPIGSLN